MEAIQVKYKKYYKKYYKKADNTIVYYIAIIFNLMLKIKWFKQ